MPIWKRFLGLFQRHPDESKNMQVLNAPSSSRRDPKKSIIKRIGLAFTSGSGGRDTFEPPAGFDFDEIEKAYNTEAYVRQAMDKYIDLMFKSGWDIVGKNQNSVDYIRLRLAAIADATHIPTKQLLIDIAEDMVVYHNVFIVKARMKGGSYSLPPGITATGVGNSEPVVGYFPLPVNTIQIARDSNGTIKKYKQEIGGADKPIEIKPEDMVHVYIDKPKGRAFGVPFLWAALDDIKLLRQIEELVARLIYKDIFPLYQYQVGLAQEGFEATDEEIEFVREQIAELTLDGGIVVPERHNISVIGSQGKALDAYQYLKYFEQRVFTGLGISETMMGRGDCYDEETQTLTDEGWKYYYEVTEGNLIATYNPDTCNVEFHKPSDGHSSHIFQHKGDMYHFTGKHVDIMVSPEHDMWIMTNREKPNWHKVQAKDLYNNGPDEFCILEGSLGQQVCNSVDIIQIPDVQYKYNIDYPNKGITSFPAEDFASFIGYFISEGYLKNSGRQYCISIAQKGEESYQRILTTIEALKLHYNTRIQLDGTYEITIFSKALWTYLSQEVGHSCYDKRIPREFMSYQPSVMQSLLDALIDGDGSTDKRQGRTSSTYYTVCDQLADDVQELAVLLGLKAKHVKTKQGDYAYSSGFINRVHISKSPTTHRYVKRCNIEKVDYDGTMYCYNVPNHLFITRRNGKVAIQGNTANRGTADNMTADMHDRIKAFQTIMAMFVTEYMVNELLREGGFDPLLRPEDAVEFRFKEIDLGNKLQLENMAIQKWSNNLITHEETRMEIGMDPVTDEGRLFVNMIGAADTANQNAIKNANMPANQTGSKPGPGSKESVITESVQPEVYRGFAQELERHWGLTREDIVDLVTQYYVTRDRKFPDFEPKEIQGIIALTKGSMNSISEKYIRHFFQQGVTQAFNESRSSSRGTSINYVAGVKELQIESERLVGILLNEDLQRLISNAVKGADASDAVAKVIGAFNALNYRLHFIAKTQSHRAYSFGFTKAAQSLGHTEMYVVVENKDCSVCQSFSESAIPISTDVGVIPPFHPNCTCKLTLSKPEGKEG